MAASPVAFVVGPAAAPLVSSFTGRRLPSVSSSARSAAEQPSVGRQGVRMDAEKEREKEEAFQVQQQILARRQNKRAQAQYFQDVQARRQGLEETSQSKKLTGPDQDPLEKWKKLKAEGKIDDIGYEEPEGSIPMPMASFGIPKYDQGARFDLRLPYADQGYEDPDADLMGKIGSFFGFCKKKPVEDKGEDKETTP